MIIELKNASESVGLKINWNKTKIMSNGIVTEMKIDNETIEIVKKFKFLGTILYFENREQEELSARISAAWKAFWAHKRFFTDKNFAL